MFVIDRRFKFHIVIIYKEKTIINTLQNIRQTDALRHDLQKLGYNFVCFKTQEITSVKSRIRLWGVCLIYGKSKRKHSKSWNNTTYFKSKHLTILIHKHNSHIHGKAFFLRADNQWCRKDITTSYGTQKLHYLDYNKSKHDVAQLVEVLRYKQKNAGSIPDGVIQILYWHNPSCRTMAMGSTETTTGIFPKR